MLTLRKLVLASALFFAVGSLVAALATNFNMMLVGRSIQGIGGGGILTLGEILITDLVPLSVRGAWFGFLSGMWAIGTVAGPLMGGGFAQSSHLGWRWIFWINLPIIGTVTIAIILFLKIDRLKGEMLAKIRKFDWFGSTIFIASTVSFLIPVTWGGIMLSAKAFDSEGRLLPGNNRQPIIRFSIFNNWTLRLIFLQTLVHGMILWSLLYFLPLYYEGVKGYSPIAAGVAVLPETLLIAPISIVVGIVSSSTGRYRWAIWIGGGMQTLGCGLLYLLDPDTRVAAFIFLNVPVAIGTGMAFTSMSLGIQAAGRPQDAAHSVTFYSFIRVFGQFLGVAVGGVVFQNQIQKKLSKYPSLAPFAEEYSKDATALVSLIQGMEAGIEKSQLVQAYADSIKMIWVVMAALSGAIFISSVFVKGYSLDQEHETLQGLNHGNREKDPEIYQSIVE
ncbi:hypothetical protein MMC31_001505 [Peltigera leucophlebia]|nr:hypothetical protein [Peltigera leucophlebia]